MNHDTPRANLNHEESDRSSDQGDGRPVWIDRTGCRTGYPGAEDVDAGYVGAESVRENRAGGQAAGYLMMYKPLWRRTGVCNWKKYET